MKISIKELKTIIREIMLNDVPTLPKNLSQKLPDKRHTNQLQLVKKFPVEKSREQLTFINKFEDEEISSHLRDEEVSDNSLDDLTVKKKEFPFVITIDPYTRFY